MLKKALNYLEFPYSVEEVKQIILQPENYNIRDFQSCKRLDPSTWTEDYGDDYLYKYHVAENSEQRIVLEYYKIMDTGNYVKQLIFEFLPHDETSCQVSVSEHVKSGNIIRRITIFADSYSKVSTYFIDMLNRILKYCKSTYHK